MTGTDSISIEHDDHNANAGTERGKKLLTQSVRELGGGRSILLDKNGKLIAGNKTFDAAQEAGLTVRVIQAERGELIAVQRSDLDLNDSSGEARRLAYMDNRVAELDLHWDADQIAADLNAGLDLNLLGFDESELLLVIGDHDDEIDAAPQLDKAEELQKKWNTALGQLWELGDHRLMCGDSSLKDDVDRLLGDSKFNLLSTDPPYGVEVKGGSDGEMTIANDHPEDIPVILAAAFRLVVPAAAKKAAFYIAAPHGPQFYEFAKAIIEAKMVWKQTLVWAKNNLVLGRSDYQQKHEVFFYGNFAHGRVWNGGRKQTSVIIEQKKRLSFIDDHRVQVTFDDEVYVIEGDHLSAAQVEPQVLEVDKPSRSELHPTIKPLKLIRRMVRNSSMMGDLVLDPFCGSGTTILACENEQRKCYAMELLPKYAAVTLQRWFDATGKTPQLIGTR